MLPIVQRELQVAARSRNFYAWRIRTGLAIVLVSAGALLSSRGSVSSGSGELFRTLCFFALLFCLIEGLRKTSDAISEEKREGTLGLLFLTDLTGFDVVLGKLTAAAVRSFNALLAFVPILAICLLLGGITGGEFWRTVLVLLASLAASLSLCIFTSTLSREKSFFAAGSLLLILCLLPISAGALPATPVAEWISAVSPITLRNAASDAYYRATPSAYWAGLSSLVAVSGLATFVASAIVPRIWQDKPKLARSKRVQRILSPRGLKRRREMMDRNPAMWLLFDPQRQKWLHGFAFALAAGAFALAGVIHLLLPKWNFTPPKEVHLAVVGSAAAALVLVAYLYVGRESSRNLAEARQNGALELVLSTPLGVDAIVEGQILALNRALMRPAAIFALFSAYIFAFAAIEQEIATFLFLFKTLIESALGIITVAWFGMWMGLTTKGITRAYVKTIAIGVLLPHIVCTPTIVNQIVLLLIAADKVKVHFRRYVADRYVGSQGATLSSVSAPTHPAPPVLR